jgi:ABC-type transport system involved in multi-copper enzyme maturation permease subunit
MTQTLALFLDAYRELNARRMFWIVLIISALIAGSFGIVGINQQGFVIFWKVFPSEIFNTRNLDRAEIYKTLFSQLGLRWWLGFIATVLALVSTASLFPDFLAGGSIDLYLSRPFGRLRLFLTKYLTGLVFVTLQVLVFCVAAFFVIGLRGNVWEPGIFVAVPLVVLFFSYLFSIMVLLGVLTRSSIAALLLTMLCWAGLWAFHTTETLLLTFSTAKQIQIRDSDRDIARFESSIQRLTAAGAKIPVHDSTQPVTFNDRTLQVTTASLTVARQERDELSDPFATWHGVIYAMNWPLPKSSETIDLIHRVLGERMHLRREDDSEDEGRDNSGSFFRDRSLMRRAGMEARQIIDSRPLAYVLGTSLAFEAVLVSLSAWLFCRRDF